MTKVNLNLQNDILMILANGEVFEDAQGNTYEGVFENELVQRLRQRGWSLPAIGFFSDEVKACGFTVKQAYLFPGGSVRTTKRGHLNRKLAKYQTVIYL